MWFEKCTPHQGCVLSEQKGPAGNAATVRSGDGPNGLSSGSKYPDIQTSGYPAVRSRRWCNLHSPCL